MQTIKQVQQSLTDVYFKLKGTEHNPVSIQQHNQHCTLSIEDPIPLQVSTDKLQKLTYRKLARHAKERQQPNLDTLSCFLKSISKRHIQYTTTKPKVVTDIDLLCIKHIKNTHSCKNFILEADWQTMIRAVTENLWNYVLIKSTDRHSEYVISLVHLVKVFQINNIELLHRRAIRDTQIPVYVWKYNKANASVFIAGCVASIPIKRLGSLLIGSNIYELHRNTFGSNPWNKGITLFYPNLKQALENQQTHTVKRIFSLGTLNYLQTLANFNDKQQFAPFLLSSNEDERKLAKHLIGDK